MDSIYLFFLFHLPTPTTLLHPRRLLLHEQTLALPFCAVTLTRVARHGPENYFGTLEGQGEEREGGGGRRKKEGMSFCDHAFWLDLSGTGDC